MQQNEQGRVVKIAGPLVLAKGLRRANLFDVVRVSDRGLIGEIIEMHGEEAYIQVYEETSGLSVGEPVFSEGRPLAMELGPGLVGGIFDGIGRPLAAGCIAGSRPRRWTGPKHGRFARAWRQGSAYSRVMCWARCRRRRWCCTGSWRRRAFLAWWNRYAQANGRWTNRFAPYRAKTACGCCRCTRHGRYAGRGRWQKSWRRTAR